MKEEKCYYLDYGMCTSGLSRFKGKKCPAEHCPHYVSESDFFTKSVTNTLKEEKTPEEVRAERERILKNLQLGKSKKQLKREEKLEQEKNNPSGSGFSLGDDPMFRALREQLDQETKTKKEK